MNTIIDIIQKRSVTQPNQKVAVFLQDGEQETRHLTYDELDAQARIMATWLQTHNMSGCRILLLYPAGMEFISGLIGCWYAGAIAVPIHCPKIDEFKANHELLNSIAEDADIAAIFTLDEFRTTIKTHLKKNVPIFTTDKRVKKSSQPYHPVIVNHDTIAWLQYTSGSTSTPKAAVVTHGNLNHSLKETIKAWQYTKHSITLNWAPHTHVYGLVCGILLPLYHGTLAMIIPPAAVVKNPLTWLRAISKYRVTHSGCPNFGYDLCVRTIEDNAVAALNLEHWQVAVNGGEIVQPRTLSAFVSKFQACGFKLKQFCSAYGMSELAGAIAVTPTGHEPRSITFPGDKHPRVSSGRILPGLHAIAVDPEHGTPVAPGEIGEIWLSGKSVVNGYWRRPEETHTVFNATLPGNSNTYFKTGDLGCVIDNELYLTGRLKEVMVIYGKKYYPLDLEITVAQAIKPWDIKLPQVVFSTATDNREAIVVVQEVPEQLDSAQFEPMEEAVRHAITREHGVNIHQLLLIPAGTIPKTTSGKLQRKKCQVLFEQNALVTLIQKNAPKTIHSDKNVTNKFTALVADVLNLDVAQIDIHAPLSKYSFDSINIIQLTTLLNETYQLSISPTALYEYATLAEFYTHRLEKQTTSIVKEAVTVSSTTTNDIAIIGMHGTFPKSAHPDAFWDNLAQGNDCISEIPSSRWNWQDLTLQWGGFIDGMDEFDADFFNISPREAALIDPQQRVFLQTVWKTIEDAGYTKTSMDAYKTGLFVGVFNHDYAELLQNNDVMDAYLTTSTMHSMIANRISWFFNFNGPSEAIDTACSSSLVAIHHAVQSILQGDCELAIAGGVNALITPTSYMSARKAGMLSEDGRCKTFDERANGYVRGEGVGAILLKKLSQAIADGDVIYGVIKGTAINHGGHVNSLTVPNPNAQADVIMSACRRAQIPVDSLQFMETHGTGTPLGDPIEINGLKKAFQQLSREQGIESLPQQSCGLGALKTNIGHLESAAGIAGVIKLLLALRHETMPANIHLKQLNPYIELNDSPFYIVNQATPWPRNKSVPRRAGVSSFGFGGANAHVIIEEGPQPILHDCNTHPHAAYLIPLSAMTASGLQQRIIDLLDWLQRQPSAPCLAALSYTLAVGRQHFQHRIALNVRTVDELKDQLSRNYLSDDALCVRYVRGDTIDWQQYYGDFQTKLSLPTYPFAKESHWITLNQPKAALHALIDADISTANTLQFSKQFSGNEFYLTDHQINNEPVLPGVVCIEMARAAGMLSNNQPIAAMTNIIWQKPIKQTDLSEPLHITLSPGAQTTAFVIADHTGSTSFVKGEIHYSDQAIRPVQAEFDIQSLSSTLPQQQTPDEIYGYFKRAGIAYGRNFQVIQHLQHDKTQVLAKLVLQSGPNTYSMHPGLFDGILQTTQALLKQRETLYLPSSIKQMIRYADLPDVCYVHARLVSSEDNHDIRICDLHIVDESGALVLAINGFALSSITAKRPYQCYEPVWTKQALIHYPVSTPRSILILGHCEKTLHAIQSQFTQDNVEIRVIDEPTHLVSTLADFIIVSLDELADNDFTDTAIQTSLDKTCYLAHALARNIIALKPHHQMQLVFVSQTPSIYARSLVGFSKTLPLEQMNIVCRYLELPNLDVLHDELTQHDIDVRYDEQKHRHVSGYQPIAEAPVSTSLMKQHGVYLITGGLGGLGYLFAMHLAEHYEAKLVLAGRSPLSSEQKHQLAGLKQAIYIQTDVSRYDDVEALVNQAKQAFGAIHGIIHAAGVTRDGLIVNKTIEQINAVTAAKINGTCHLHTATRHEPLDFFVLFSSIAATFGNTGQSDYAYANSFLDEFARLREQQHIAGQCSGRSLSINWPLWQEGGLTIAPEYQQWLEKTMGIVSLTTAQGLQSFSQLLHANTSNGIVLPGDQRLLVKTLNDRLTTAEPVATNIAHPDNSTEQLLKQIVADTIKRSADTIDVNLPLEHYGIDSLMIIELNQQLAKIFPGLPQTLFFEYQTLSALTQYFIENQILPTSGESSRLGLGPTAADSWAKAQPTAVPEQEQDIAIIGVSGRYPQANDLTEFWNNLLTGKDCITEIPSDRWDWKEHKTYSKWGGFLSNPNQFDPLFFNISPREASLMDPQERLFLETAWKTIEDAGYPKEQVAGKNIGVYVGVMYSEYQLFGNENTASDPFVPTHSVFSSIANRVSYWFDFHGPSLALDTMCSSSLTAIHLACKSIQDGDCSLALAGGVNLSLHQNKYLLLSHGKFLASDGHCRSFGDGGDGYVPGEGVGAVLLKPLTQALHDGDHIYAVIKGTHINHGGKTNGYTVPNPNAQADLIKTTYQKANISPAMVSYIEAHGTGTSLGDPIEIAGLNKAFQQQGNDYQCAIGSVKSNIGHCESAAGIAAVTKVLLQLQHSTLVPSLMSETLNANINWSTTPFIVQQKAEPWNTEYKIAGISSFGAGGSNAHLILSEAPVQARTTGNRKSHYLLTLSAKTVEALKQREHDLLTWIISHPEADLEHISYTLNCGRSHFIHRRALVVSSLDEAVQLLQQPNITSSENNGLFALANAYIAGQNIDWDRLHAGESRQKMSLPTYPFAQEQYWYTDEIEADSHQAMDIPVQEISLEEQVSSFLMQQVVNILKLTRHSVSAEKSLSEYGMDSVHFIELSKRIADHYQITLTPAVWNTYNSLAAISQYLIRQFPNETARLHPVIAHAAVTMPRLTIKPRSVQPTMQRGQDIAIIGMQGMFPQSNDLTTFWQHLLDGKDLVTEIPSDRWNWREYYGDSKLHANKTNSKWGGFINQMDQFDAEFFNLSAREVNLMDPQHRLFLEVVWKTIEDAGYNPFDLASQSVGVFAGVEFHEYQSLIAKQHHDFHGYIASGNAHSMLANRVSYFFDFQGPSEAIDTACSGSLVAIHRAVQSLRQNECNLAIAGGVSLILDPDNYIITSQLGALSPDGRCKTFDESANGYVKSEGIAALLLKPLHQAQRDGDHIYGVIKASAVNHGGKAQSLTAPNAMAQSKLLINAHTQAGIDPATITYIETHGTGTALGDPVEVEGLKLAFNTLLGKSYQSARIALGSVKTNAGHLEAASGIAGVIKVLLSMAHETIPGMLHFKQLNPYIHLTDTPFYLATDNQPWQRLHDAPLRAGVSSFGFGGSNAHLVIEEGRPHQISMPHTIKPCYLITLSAKHRDSLQQKIIDLHEWLLSRQDTISLHSLSFTLNVGRAHFNYRSALVVQSLAELIQALSALGKQEIPEYCIMNDGQACHMHGPVFEELYQLACRGLQSDNPEHYRRQLFILADLYTKHHPIDWQHVYGEKTIQRVGSLPVYPFIKQRYWFDVEFNSNALKQTVPSLTPVMTPREPQTVIAWLQSVFAEALHIPAERIQPDQTYEVYGIDSVLGLEITNRLQNIVGPIPKTLLYERNRLVDLAKYFMKHHQEKLNDVIPTIRASTVREWSSRVPLPDGRGSDCPEDMASTDIAIIGLSGTFPMASSMDEFWENLVAGRDCVGTVPNDRWNYEDYPVVNGTETSYLPHGGFIPDVDKFDPLFFNISPRDAALMDPQERLFMQCAWSTLEDGGYTREKLEKQANNSVGVFAGVTFNYYPLFAAEEWQKGNRVPLDIQTFSVANRISYFLNLNGPSFVVDTACSSSLAAIHLACESLQAGDCAMAIAGGVNLSLHPAKYHFLGSFGFMSEEGRCTSFADGGTGYVPSEGVGAVLLKPLAQAIRDNDNIYGVIKGSAMNHGGKTSGYTVPNPNAQSNVILQALQRGNIDPRTISYVEAHGTGTSLGDPIEIRGLQDAFETRTQDKQFCAIGSVKSNIGHLEAAAGISQVAKVLLQMREQQLVPTIHTKTLNPFIDFNDSPFYVQRESKAWPAQNNTPRRAAVSSFGAGGTNVHMIIEDYVAATQTSSHNGPFIFVLSALNEERLAERVQHMLAYIQKNQHTHDSEWLRNACYTLQVGREQMQAKFAAVISSREELLLALSAYPATQTYTQEIIQHWLNGGKIDWDTLYQSPIPRIISLPTYPFAKRRCWFATTVSEPVVSKPALEVNDWLYSMQWETALSTPDVTPDIGGKWLIFSDHELGFVLQQSLGTSACIYSFAGPAFSQHSEQVYYINSSQPDDYVTLFSTIQTNHNDLKGIIYLCSQSQPDSDLPLFHCLKALANTAWATPLVFCLVSQGATPVAAQDDINVWQHHLWSMTRIFGAEQAHVQPLLLDLDPQASLNQNAALIAHELARYQATQTHIAYRKNKRYTQRLIPTPPSQFENQPAWRAPVAALVTGGLGALGYEVARFIIAQGTRFVLLTGTSELTSHSLEKNNWLKQLESTGAKIKYSAVDVTNHDAMKTLVQDTETDWQQAIDGVFHLAGITTDNVPIANLDEALWRRVLDVKIKGAMVLHQLFNQPGLSSFVLFSSIAAVPHFGLPGLSAYAAANEFMSGLAWHRRHLQLPAMSINWVAWSEKGMSHRYQHDAFLSAVGMSPLPVEQGMSIFKHLLQLNPAEITVCKIDWKTFLQVNAAARQLDFFRHFISKHVTISTATVTNIQTEDQVRELIPTLFANILSLEKSEIDWDTPFQQYGMDSITGLTFIAELGQHISTEVSPMDLYRYPTLKQLIAFLIPQTSRQTGLPFEIDLETLSAEQLNALIDAELNELELIYD